MTTNEGAIDRGLRIAVGLALIGLAATDTVGPWGYIGIVPVITGAVGYCPLYALIGVDTCPTHRS